MSMDRSEGPWADGRDEPGDGSDEPGDGSRPDGYGEDRGQNLAQSEGGCDPTVPAWLAGLHPMLPETLFVPYHPGRARFCFRKLGKSEDCGLVCFSAPDVGEPYRAAFLARHGFAELRRLSLDEACDLARDYHFRVNCVALIDDPFHPVIQIVCWFPGGPLGSKEA